MEEWAQWFGNEENRRVALTETALFQVSTICLGLNHRFSGKGPPILFETMVFDLHPHLMELFGALREVHSDLDDETRRYTTWNEAEYMHNAIVERLLRQEAESSDDISKALEKLGHER